VIKDGEPRLVSVQPKDLLDQLGVTAARRAKDRIRQKYVSEPRTMDIFVEPVLPRPQFVIFGASPVGVALAELAQRFGFFVIVCARRATMRSMAKSIFLPMVSSRPAHITAMVSSSSQHKARG